MNTSHHCCTDSIGCVHRSESCISMLCWYISVSVDSRRPTWLTICSQSLNFQVDDAYGHHRHRHWLYHGHAVEPSATACSRLQQQGPGTVCRRKWRHHDHSHLLNLNLKHIYLNFSSLIVDSVKWLRCFCTIHLKLYIISYHTADNVVVDPTPSHAELYSWCRSAYSVVPSSVIFVWITQISVPRAPHP